MKEMKYKKKKKPPYKDALKEAEEAISITGKTQSGKAKQINLKETLPEFLARMEIIFKSNFIKSFKRANGI